MDKVVNILHSTFASAFSWKNIDLNFSDLFKFDFHHLNIFVWHVDTSKHFKYNLD